MKIGFVVDDSLDRTDGVQQYVLSLGAWLTAQGHQIHYLVGETQRRDIPQIHSLSRNRRVRFNKNRLSVPLPAKRKVIKRLLQQEQFDVLHVQMPYSPQLAARIIKAAPRQTVIVGTFHILPYGRLQRLGARLLSWRLRRTTKRFDYVWAVSRPAQRFAASLGIKAGLLPNVVDLKKYATGRRLPQYKRDFTIVFLGRLVERKGCKELLKAVGGIIRGGKIPGLQVVIVGDGPQATELQSWVDRHGLSQQINFVGQVSEQAKPDYLASADIAVFPSLGGESFGIVLLEAMAAKAKVVLGGDNPGYRSVLQAIPQSLCRADDPTAMARQIYKIYQNKALQQQIHLKQQRLVRQYDVAVIGQKLVSYYQTLQRRKLKQL